MSSPAEIESDITETNDDIVDQVVSSTTDDVLLKNKGNVIYVGQNPVSNYSTV